MMKVAVLGGTIFVGRAVVEELVAAGHDVAVVHRGQHEPDAGFPDVEHIHADRADLPAIVADAVVDCRALSAADVDAVLARIPDIPLVVLSSVDVYPALRGLSTGTVECDVPIDESTPVRTERFPYRGVIPGMDDYEKLDCEERYLARGGVVLRLPFVTGPHDYQRREEAVLRRVRAGRDRMPIGSGNLLASHVAAGDVGTACVAALASGVSGEVYVLAEHPTPTTRQWVEAIVDAAGSAMQLVTVPDTELPDDLGHTGTHQQHLLVSPAKAMRHLSWTPTPWRDAVRTSVEWHLEHPPPPSEGSDDFSADLAALDAL
jgi:nucleoside-diphosphate-sugar epimerase